MKMVRILPALLVLFLYLPAMAQNDTIPVPQKRPTEKNLYKTDSVTRRVHDPRKATLYSAILPGLGQIYNRKYWKAPIAWAGVGIPAYTYFDNRNWYNKCQYAISIMDSFANVGAPVPDSLIRKVDPKLQGFVTANDENSLRTYRNEFRKNEDYSILFFILLWGLNVVDATVDAHLMGFDISPQLSLRLAQPSGSVTLAGPLGPGMGLSLLIDWHRSRFKPLAAR